MLAAWRAGDEAGLEQRLEDDFDGYPELAEELVYERNDRWAEQVAEMLEGDDDVLVVVGAEHLVGDRGLPALLEKRGFKVAEELTGTRHVAFRGSVERTSPAASIRRCALSAASAANRSSSVARTAHAS